MLHDNSILSPDLEKLAGDFIWNADNALKDSSPLYEGLARRIAQDPEMLALAAHTQPHQPVMNMLFASVHYLLLSGIDDPLRLFFADLTRKPNVVDDPYPIFRAFAFEHADEIIPLLQTRRVQTNEVARCALFLPAFGLVAQHLDGEPFAMIEVGASAGLNLNWDKYAYDYGDGKLLGEPQSPIVLECEVRGHARPVLPAALPLIHSRTGIDLNPNNVFDEDAMLWLRALVWPEQLDRAVRLQRAIALARVFPPQLLQGDALALAPRLIQDTPHEIPIVLFHSFVLNQVPAEMRTLYYELLAANSAKRILFDLAIEPGSWPTQLVLTTFRHGNRTQEPLANVGQHGRWLEWIY